MSIQKLSIDNQGGAGIKKTIDEKSMRIVLNMVQTFNYSKPIPSTVRELASNAVDAQREKEIALEILTGKKKVEDYFIEKKGEEFEDSRFDLSYYSPEWLNTEDNDVIITYKENEGMGFVDTFTVRDNGVGMSPKRLESTLRLGYSSKRNSKELMGGFGLGGKAPLATMTPFYTTITCYNGMLFKLNVFADKAESLIGLLNEDTGLQNKSVTFKNGAVVYYEESTSKNYTEIVVPVKKLNKQKYIEAVESQLLYLPGIKFFVESADGYNREIDFKARILYESENLVISRNSQYSRPHLILVKDKESNFGVCYNEINYKELELEQRHGAVALKVQAKATTKDDDGNEIIINDGVTVTPNREDIVWNDDTKKYLLGITKNVTQEASEIVAKQLTEDDFLKWVWKCSTVLSNIAYGTPLYELARMIDRDAIKPVYPKDKSIKFEQPERMFWGLNVRVVSQYQSHRGSKLEINRSIVEHWSNIINRKVYSQTGNTSNTKDKFLSQSEPFITIQVLDADDMLEKMLGELKLKGTVDAQLKDAEDKFWEKVAKRDKIVGFLSASTELLDYDAVEVPEDFMKVTETLEAAEAANVSVVGEAYRKLNGLVVIQTPRAEVVGWHTELVWEVHEVKAVDLPTLATRIYYGFDEDKDKIRAACRVLGESAGAWYNKDIAVIKVSRKLEKIICKHAEHVSKFFFNISEENVITMSEEVVKYMTGSVLSKGLTNDYKFLLNYKEINPDVKRIYDYLLNYKDKYYDHTLRLRTEIKWAIEAELVSTLEKCAQFQRFVKVTDDPKLIAEKSTEFFGTPSAVDANTLELVELERLELLKEYISEIHPLFNLIPNLTENYRYDRPEMPVEAIKLLEIILKAKGLDVFQIPEELAIAEELTKEEDE
jgi:hypothetical protein